MLIMLASSMQCVIIHMHMYMYIVYVHTGTVVCSSHRTLLVLQYMDIV